MKYVLQRFEKKMKLIGFGSSNQLWLQNKKDEWIHDVYEECTIHHGKIYSLKKPINKASTFITGFFQDEDTKKWIYVENGVAQHAPSAKNQPSQSAGWFDDLGELFKKEGYLRFL